MKKTRKGLYKPQNPQKYRGNVDQIVYRSGWERHFMVWCDTTEAVLQWSSEETVIPYRSPIDDKIHRYFIDFWIRIRTSSGKIEEKIIEVKPFSQTQPPKQPSPRAKHKSHQRYLGEAKTFAVNRAKWEAAQEFAKAQNMEFMIITEKQLGIGRR